MEFGTGRRQPTTSWPYILEGRRSEEARDALIRDLVARVRDISREEAMQQAIWRRQLDALPPGSERTELIQRMLWESSPEEVPEEFLYEYFAIREALSRDAEERVARRVSKARQRAYAERLREAGQKLREGRLATEEYEALLDEIERR